MKLSSFDKPNTANTALKQMFNVEFDPSKLDRAATRAMLVKVKNLISEAREKKAYANHNDPAFLKLMFIAESLTKHYKSFKPVRMVVENTEVEKSQVILAAQDMVDSVQKMVEEVNDMLVKELPALTDSIQSEIGVNESQSFNQQASEALTSLNQALSQSKNNLQNALNTLTGIQGGPAFNGGEKAVTDISTSTAQLPGGGEMTDTQIDATLPAEEPELDAGPVGRAKRA